MNMRTNPYRPLGNDSRNGISDFRELSNGVSTESSTLPEKASPLGKPMQLLNEFVISKPGTAIAVGLVVGGLLGWMMKKMK